MKRGLIVPAHVLEAIRSHGRADYPEECCGILIGESLAEQDRVAEARPVPNVREEERRRRFLISPTDYFRADRDARERGLSLLGFYHSHPDRPARPSEFDREQAWPNLHYIVMAVSSGEPGGVTSWILSDDRGRFEEEELLLSP